MGKGAGIVLISGSILFLIAAFMPISMRVFSGSIPQKQIEYIQNDRRGWLISCFLFGTGGIVTVVGFAIFAIQVISDSAVVKLALYLATAGAAFGALQWVIIVYKRATLPLEKIFNNENSNNWAFPAYTILTQIALIIVGFVLLQTGYQAWLGWGTVVLAAISLIAFLVFKDMPPFTHYLITLVIGIILAR